MGKTESADHREARRREREQAGSQVFFTEREREKWRVAVALTWRPIRRTSKWEL